MRAALCALGWLVLAALPAQALEPGTYRYVIRHQLFGDIGSHRITVREENDAVIVEHAAELAVRLLTFTAFRRESRYREVWRDGRLIAFEGLTEDNGERFLVTARAAGDALIIEGPAGRIVAPAATVPSQPSIVQAIARAHFMDIKTGELLAAEVRAAGRERLQLDGRTVEAERYEVSGDLEQHVWFDATGVWVQWRLWRQGAAITLTRAP